MRPTGRTPAAFFFSSRRRHTRWPRDWSSDVCSSDLLAPAVSLAKEGLLVDWVFTLLVTAVARELAADPDAARMFLDDGKWPISGGWTTVCDRHLDQRAMAQTLEQLAHKGPRELYEGDVAHALRSEEHTSEL